MKALKGLGILLGIPALGVLLASIVGAIAMPSNGGSAGDGILIILLVVVSLIISVPLAIALAARAVLREPQASDADSIEQSLV